MALFLRKSFARLCNKLLECINYPVIQETGVPTSGLAHCMHTIEALASMLAVIPERD